MDIDLVGEVSWLEWAISHLILGILIGMVLMGYILEKKGLIKDK